MKKTILTGAVVALAALPASASAHPSRAHPLKGTFQLVGADGDYVRGNFGKAQLVDGKRNDKLSVHIRRAGRKASYVFRLEKAAKACAADAPGGTAVPGWKYRRDGVLKTSRKGVANSSARSRTFRAERDVEYFVGVYTRTADGAPDQLLLCAELRGKKPHRRGHHKPKGHHKPAAHGKRGDKAKPGGAPRGNGKSGETPRGNGKSGETPRGHGKPDDAPRGHGKPADKPAGNGKSGDTPRGHGKPDDAPRGRG
jgi:hypothetical protein